LQHFVSTLDTSKGSFQKVSKRAANLDLAWIPRGELLRPSQDEIDLLIAEKLKEYKALNLINIGKENA
jgi:hypothetical protein